MSPAPLISPEHAKPSWRTTGKKANPPARARSDYVVQQGKDAPCANTYPELADPSSHDPRCRKNPPAGSPVDVRWEKANFPTLREVWGNTLEGGHSWVASVGRALCFGASFCRGQRVSVLGWGCNLIFRRGQGQILGMLVRANEEKPARKHAGLARNPRAKNTSAPETAREQSCQVVGQ